MPHSSAEGAAPVIVRVAGLPADTLARFATALGGGAGELRALEGALAAARAALADVLHAAVPGVEPPLRRLLLAVRRDAFNGRPLARHGASERWAAVREAGGAALDEVLDLEARHAEASARWEAEFAAERERQTAALREPLADAAFLRGLALASADLARDLSRPGGAADRKAHAALLRYVSRAAGKVSPFSTFTGVGVGTVGDGAPGLRGTPRRARSLVRVKPHLLDPCAALLRRWPPLRDRLPVSLSEDLVETEPGVLLFLRPAGWELDAAGTLAFREEALRSVRIAGPLLPRLRQALAAGPLTRGDLIIRLAAADRDADAVARQVDQLVETGVLALSLPWSAHADHLEAEMRDALRALPADARPEALTAALDRLVGLQQGWADAADPAAALAAIKSAAEDVWRAAAPLGGLAPDTPRVRHAAHTVYEDVHLRGEGEGGELYHLPRPAAERALADAEPLVRLAALFDRRHDLQRTLAAFAADRFGAHDDGVGVLELFLAFRAHWRDYLKARAAARGGDRLGAWNPLGLPEIDALARARDAVWAGLEGCSRVEGDEQRIDLAALDALLDAAGEGCATGEGGACLFLQPADAAGRRWVLNRLREGTGRFGSRYTPAMDDLTRRRYTDEVAARGTVTIHGEPAELLDLAAVQGDTLNVHAPQTPAVLRRAGETPRASSARQVRVADLRVTFRGGRATLRGRDGRALAPVYLGVAGEPYFPPLVRFLAAFGPSSLAPVLPPAVTRGEGDTTLGLRAVAGTLVIRRRRWSFDAAPLAAALAGPHEPRAFAALCAWRAAHGIPDRVFLEEPAGGGQTRPQYLDLTSPLFASLFRAVVQSRAGTLTLTEALPDARDLPRDAAGRGWATEVLLDSLALRPRSRSPRATATAPRTRETPPPANVAGDFPPSPSRLPIMEAV